MATVRLSQRRVDALRPRKSAYDVRDRELKGFGVRVLPSGAKRYFIHSQYQGRRTWKIVGGSDSFGVDEARARARDLMASIHKGTNDGVAATTDATFETVADEVFRRYARNWKPSTLRVNLSYYRSHILPWFGGRPIADIAPQDVRHWFASLHNTPVAADRSAPILSVIMRQAEIYGYRPEGTNPCAGIKRYRRQGRERFLSTAELRRLGEVLARHEADHPQAVAIIRLLLLTGCRKGEIITLKWRHYREGKLFLPDSKTGPRTVSLSAEAAEVLSAIPREPGNPWVIPGTRAGQRLSSIFEPWARVRARAGLEDVRIHDLRHSYASRALALGESLPVIAKLLGHAQIQTTARYTHLTRDAVKDAATRVAGQIGEDIFPATAARPTARPAAERNGCGGACDACGACSIGRACVARHSIKVSAARVAAAIGADILPAPLLGSAAPPTDAHATSLAQAS